MSSRSSRPAALVGADSPSRGYMRRERLVDSALAVGFLVLALVTSALASVILSSDGHAMPSTLETLAGAVAVSLPIAFRRRFPVSVMIIVSTAFIVLGVRGHPDDLLPSIAEFLVVFSANVWSPSRRRALVWSLVVVVAMFAWLAIDIATQVSDDSDSADVVLASSLYSVVLNALFFLAAIHFGRVSRESRSRRRALERSDAALRAANDRIAEQAIGDERARIARELHDVVAHHVAVIGIQAGAARRTLDRPEIARGALAAVEETARTTIDELDRLLTVMRSRDGLPPEPVAGLAALPDLVADTRALGLDVRLEIDGDTRDVPDGVGATLYRIAQEALTNTLKHGAARCAVIRVVHGEGSVGLEVDDDGLGSSGRAARAEGAGRGETGALDPAAAPSGSGLGHRGMRERVDLHGGRLTVGPREGGGYRVRVDLPVVAHPPKGTTLFEGE